MALTNAMWNQRREADCIAVGTDRKYYKTGDVFIKRSLRPHEWQISPFKGTVHVPRLGKERLLNEAAALKFIAEKTSIPVPRLYGCFEDCDAVYLIVEYVEGVAMAELSEEQKGIVKKEVEKHLQTLSTIRSSRPGGPSGLVVPPHRVIAETFKDTWKLREGETNEYGFCHNDMSQHNIVVDPESLKIQAILDWEYAGYYPAFYEGHFYERDGPSGPIGDEVDDVERLIAFLRDNEEA